MMHLSVFANFHYNIRCFVVYLIIEISIVFDTFTVGETIHTFMIDIVKV